MKSILTDSLAKSYTYDQYRNAITALLKEGKSTGNEQSEALTHYSELNETRMNRLEKTITITDEFSAQLQQLQREYIWLVISEGWCGDAAQIVPVIYKMAELSPKIDLRLVFRDENDALMNAFLTDGARSIPKLIVLDKETMAVLGDFGPRPQGAKQLISDYKAEHGKVDETAKTNLQLWYLHDKGLSIQKEIMALMATLEPTAVQMPQE
ncbi:MULTISPECIES: thioredoxin family protein [Flavobacterium]|uniref:Thioredoxin family protein n=1 Tax=Flavobacterium sedimenticola TaxID=3043286 RepID=A0ABT6XP31_9FLAO|nr:thioredoxin family protein [Flavobacterium sedimenticola]MDI9256414.1 thioredoxin family protein [Flavobacterium sedimenticola]